MKKDLKELFRGAIVEGAKAFRQGADAHAIIESQVAYLKSENLDIHSFADRREIAECLYEYAIKYAHNRIQFN